MTDGQRAHLLLIVLWLGTGFGQSEGVRFFSGTWAEVRAEARRQHKPIFLTVSASWCPSCRRMAREGLVDSAVGTIYNNHFINYQLDAHLGEGPAIAKQYNVVSYPTSLFFTPDGQLMHRAVGYGGVNGLVQQAAFVRRLPTLRRALRKRSVTVSESDTLRATATRYTNYYIGDLISYLSLTQRADCQIH